MILHQLENPPGAVRKKKRKGRGHASTLGKTAGRGQKGQHARNTVNPGFEGGQTPLHRRLPRRGFTNIFKRKVHVINLLDLVRRPALAAKETIGIEDLVACRAVRNGQHPVKVLGVGQLDRAVTIHAHMFSKSAIEKIEAAGGKAVILES